MEGAGSKLSESAGVLLQQEELMTRLDDLVHNEHMVVGHQGIVFDVEEDIKKSESRITKTLALFKESAAIKKFLVDDFFQRAARSIAANAKTWPDQNRSNYLINSWRERTKVEAILDPMNLILLSNQFIEQGFIEDAKIPESLLALIDLALVYSCLFCTDD